MSDIMSTLAHFELACSEMKVQPHPYVTMMLEREKIAATLAAERGEFRSSMHLYLAGNNHLLCKKRLEDADCQLLAKFLLKNSFITSIDLRYNNIGNEGVKLLASMLAHNTHLLEVNLMCNNIGPSGAEALAKALMINETLLLLRLNGNKLETKEVKGGMYLAQALQINTTLQHLDVGDTDLTIGSVIAFATILRHNTSVRSININRPILFTHQEETTVHFAKMLKINTFLREIHLQKYDMRDFGAFRLAENLMYNFTLKYLDLSCNRITRDGMQELAKVLKENTALETLDMGYNRLEDDGAIHVANAIKIFNSRLKCLVLVYNNISSLGLCAIASAMKINNTLTNVYIWGNKLEEPACIAFNELIKSNRLLLENTDIKPYIVDDVTYLCELNHGIRRHYYYSPVYGDDVAEWQQRGANPRSMKTKGTPFSTFDKNEL